MKSESLKNKILWDAFFASVVILFLSSCATTKTLQKKYPVHVTNTRVIDLFLPEHFGKSVDSLYMLQGSFGKSSFYVQALMQSDERGIFISLLNDFGVEMGTLTYTSDELLLDSSMFPKSLKVQYIIIDIQFAFYDITAISSALQKVGLNFVVEKNKGIETRKIMRGKKCIEEITKSGNTIKIINHLRGYEYNLSEAQ
ncbi:MAG: DUF3261 domain-containing protein [Treponema sp.]|nr:DUF3261 domain-containing protein [Treponema sp.]